MRVPANLYREVNETLLSGPERPSYGQLVMWSVEDHRADVIEAIISSLPDPSDRSPRGRRLAQDRVPVGLQLLATERDQLDEIAAAVSAHVGEVRGGEAPTVTRTAVAIAALEVALRSHRPRRPVD